MKSNRRERYAVGLVVAPEDGAIVVVEKCPRKKPARSVGPRPRSVDALSEAWEDALEIVAVERLAGRMVEMADSIATALSEQPIAGDYAAYLESAALGPPIAALLGDRGVHVGRIVIAPEGEACDPKTGEWSISLERLQNRIALAFETGRLGAAHDLDEGQATLHALERLAELPETGAARDVAIAAAVAVWTADTRPTNGPWSSAFDPPADHPAAAHFEEKKALRALADEERETRRRGGYLRRALQR